jgi:lysophospholipase L1-like esterase
VLPLLDEESRFKSRMISLRFPAALAVALGVMTGAAGAAELPQRCAVPGELLQSPFALARTTAKLHAGGHVTIVAIGSSSTAGTGASSRRTSYPSQLQDDLRQLFPAAHVTVLNRGVPGDTASAMIRRFRKDAIEPKPDLIIWQTGTNSALGGGDIDRFARKIEEGIAMARAEGIEIMLMGPQYAPRFESASRRMSFIDRLRQVADAQQVPMFRRYEIMKHWVKSGQFSVKTMIDADGLHLTDLSYDCLGTLVAHMIARAEFATAQR